MQWFRSVSWIMLLIIALAVNAETKTGSRSRQALSLDPLSERVDDFLKEDLERLLFQGTSEFRKGNYPEAARCFLSVLHRDANNPEVMFLLAESYAHWGHPEKAARFLRHAVNAGLDPNRVFKSKAYASMRFDPMLRAQRSALTKWSASIGKTAYLPGRRMDPLRIHLPPNFDSKRTYTLLIGLHGNGDNAANFSRIWRHFGRNNFIFAVPRGSYEKVVSPLVPGRRFSWDLETRDRELWQRADPLVIDNIMQVREYIARHYSIGDTYLLGFSQGAAYTWATAIRNPERIRGVICFAGILPPADKPWSLFTPTQMSSALQGMRIFVAHGRDDRAIAFRNSENITRKLSEMGCRVAFHPFSGGHELPPTLLKKAAAWMMKPSAKN